MDNKFKFKANIWKFSFLGGLSGLVLYYSFDKVFMQIRGLSVTEIVLVEIVFAITAILFEIPSGALADRWSRKYVLALNFIFFMLNTFFWVVAHDIKFFLLGSFFAGIHVSLVSGTFTSLVYDTLNQIGDKYSYEKIWGNVAFYDGAVGIAAGIGGAMIADQFGITVPFWLTLVFSFIAVLVCLTLKEPPIHRTTGEVKYWEHIFDTFKHLRSRPILIHLVALLTMLLSAFVLIDEYKELYFVKVGIPIFFLGYLGAVGSGTEALAGKFAYRLNRFQRKNVYLFLLIFSTIGFLLTGYLGSKVGIIFVFFPIAATFLAVPLFLSDLHKELPSSHRATGESFITFAERLVIIPIAFGFSYLADSISLFLAYFGIGVLLSVYFLFYLLGSYRKISYNNNKEN